MGERCGALQSRYLKPESLSCVSQKDVGLCGVGALKLVSVRTMWGSAAEVVIPLLEVAILLLMSSSSSSEEEQQPTSGVLTSPNYPDRYLDNIELVQKIQVLEGNTIWIRFTDFQCDIYEKVRITDEGQFRTALESLYSSSEEVNLMNWRSEFLSKTNMVEVRFRTFEHGTDTGWRPEWGMVRAEENRKRSGILTSLNFPEPYPASHHFTHEIKVEQGKLIRIHFTDFETEKDEAWVKIAQGSVGNLTPKLSGKSVPEDVTTKPCPVSHCTLYVEFLARKIGGWRDPPPHSGWRLEWTEL